uniref:Uncharacterized protein n=1 Tax=Glossina palpalis gambiensis TaxID=67801 RepID=A0A1B0ASQ4_9MUSC
MFSAIRMPAALLALHLQVRFFTWSVSKTFTFLPKSVTAETVGLGVIYDPLFISPSTIRYNDFDDDISNTSSSSSSSSSISISISSNKSSRYSFCCGHNAVFDCNEAVVRV